MSHELQKADQIAFHFYTKLFYVVNQARATAEPRVQGKVDKWFNLETPDSDLFTKEAREPYKNISQALPAGGPPPLEIQVVLCIPELNNNQVLVHLPPETTRRFRVEPTPRYIVLETWTLSFAPRTAQEDGSIDVALPTIYKHGIPLFRSLYSLLRALPTWKLYKRLKRRTGLSIELRVGSGADHRILEFDCPPSPSTRVPLSTQAHTFSSVPHPLGTLTLSARFLETPTFQLEELESVLSSRFISQDLGGSEGFVPTLTKNSQRDSSVGSSSGMRSTTSRSPPKRLDESATIAERFILPSRTASNTPSAASPIPVRNIPQPPRQLASGEFAGVASSPSGLAISRLRKESMGSASSPSSSIRDLPGGAGVPFATTNPSLSSLSSSPSSGPLPIRRPGVSPVNPFKSNTVSASAQSSSPSLSIRQAPISGSPLSTGLAGSHHSRTTSLTGGRVPPSPIGAGTGGFGGGGGLSSRPSPPTVGPFGVGGLDAKRPGTSGSAGSATSDSNRDRRPSLGVGMIPGSTGDSADEGRVAIPPRKRYSSSFGHRYANSVGSTGGTSADGGPSAVGGSGRNTPAIPSAVPSGLGLELGEAREKKDSGVNSFSSKNTDEDDISVFVQDIDVRKPLSGRHKEREKRDWDRQQQQLPSHLGQGHDRYPSEASEASTIKPDRFSSANSTLGRTAVSPLSSAPPSRFSTISAATAIPGSSGLSITRDLDGPSQAQMSTSPPALSLSPTRGPMLTNPNDVGERLKRMQETFNKSLEAFPVRPSAKRKTDKGKEREREDDSSRPSSATSQPTSPSARAPTSPHRQSSTDPSQEESTRDSPFGGVPPVRSPLSPYPASDDDAQLATYAGRGLSIRAPRDRAPLDDFGMGHTGGVGMGLRLGRGGRRGELDTPSMDSSLMGRSDVVGGSGGQASDELVGKMELYEERKRRGFY
ncbi:autophagy-related protein 13-domain-containing protein [Coprinopsis sp. MPI-PUGE-AT-0042]|nr:autophagy-related protein 13-domain-containing protein [Coprinopsis sp. MPI-PUGE-AT-0042]